MRGWPIHVYTQCSTMVSKDGCCMLHACTVYMHYFFIGRFSNCIVYYGLSLGASSLGGGRYLSLVLSGLVELPGLYVSYQLLNRYVQQIPLSYWMWLQYTQNPCNIMIIE